MSSSSSSHTPCAACKFLRRKCTQECVFAPYFPPDEPQKFANVHRVYGASNVAKILNEIDVSQREDAVTSLAYEAEARIRDPVNGCIGFITALHNKLKKVQNDLYNSKKELSTYIGPQAALILPLLQTAHQYHNPNFQYNMTVPVMAGIPTGANSHGEQFREPVIQMFEARFNSGFEAVGSVNNGGELVNQINGDNNAMSMSLNSLSLGTFDHNPYNHQIQPQQQQQQQQVVPNHHQHSIEYQLQARVLIRDTQAQQKSEGEENEAT